MTPSSPRLTDDLIARALRSRAGAMPPGLVSQVLATVDAVPQRRRVLWLGPLPARASRIRLLLVAALVIAGLAGAALLAGARLATVKEPLVPRRFDAVFVRPPADGDVTAASTIVAVGADGTERLIASVPGVATDWTAFGQRMALSQAGRLALLVRDGDRVGWAILDVTDPGAMPIPVVLPGRDDSSPGVAIWGPGERLAIVLSPQSDREAVAFVDPTTGAATVQPLPIGEYGCFANRCSVWADDGSGVVRYRSGPPSGLEILGPDGHVAPFESRAWPSSIGDRDVNAAGELLLGGTDPMDQLTTGSFQLSVRAPGGEERVLLPVGGVEISDRAWAADGRGAWLLTAEWQAASRPVTLERFSPPSKRTPIASFVAAVDVPAKDVYAPAATFDGLAPDNSLAVLEVAMTSSDPVVFQGKLVDLRSGVSRDVDGTFVGWLATQEQPQPSPVTTQPPAQPTAPPPTPSPSPSPSPSPTPIALDASAAHWTKLGVASGSGALVGFDGGYVALGSLPHAGPPGSEPAAFFSADGVSWAGAPLASMVPNCPDWGPAGAEDVPDAEVRAIATNGSEIVIVGEEAPHDAAGCANVAASVRPVAWYSTDGRAWQRSAPFEVGGLNARATAVWAISNGWQTAVEGAVTGTITIWESTDGLAWSQAAGSGVRRRRERLRGRGAGRDRRPVQVRRADIRAPAVHIARRPDLGGHPGSRRLRSRAGDDADRRSGCAGPRRLGPARRHAALHVARSPDLVGHHDDGCAVHCRADPLRGDRPC